MKIQRNFRSHLRIRTAVVIINANLIKSNSNEKELYTIRRTNETNATENIDRAKRTSEKRHRTKWGIPGAVVAYVGYLSILVGGPRTPSRWPTPATNRLCGHIRLRRVHPILAAYPPRGTRLLLRPPTASTTLLSMAGCWGRCWGSKIYNERSEKPRKIFSKNG